MVTLNFLGEQIWLSVWMEQLPPSRELRLLQLRSESSWQNPSSELAGTAKEETGESILGCPTALCYSSSRKGRIHPRKR